MAMVYESTGAGGRSRSAAVVMVAIVMAVVGVVVLTPIPALGHGGADEANAVDLVEQALAIVVNSPDAVGEALERVEAALVEVAEEPTKDLDVASLERAAVALEAGDLHGAEDALVASLGIDPHAEAVEPVEAVEESASVSTPDAAPDDSSDVSVAPAEELAPETEGSGDVEQAVETAAEATGAPTHGLTERVDGGFRAPSGTGIAALVVAGVLAVGGFALAHSRTVGER